jgi:hypothetical protein
MGPLWFANIQPHPTDVLDLTSLTVAEFRELVPPFEAALQAHMTAWQTWPGPPLHQWGIWRAHF